MEKTITTKIIYRGKVIKLRVDQVQMESGRRAEREVVEHPGAVAVLAITGDEEVIFVRQYRKAVEKELLEIPAGTLKPGEEPLNCAARELAEETGLHPGKLQLLATYYTAPGFATEKLYIYMATELEPVQVEKPEDEDLQVVSIPLKEAIGMARQAGIEDGKTLIALLLAAGKRSQ